MGANYGYANALNIGVTGITVISSSSSQSVAIPNNAVGSRTRLVRLLPTGNLYVKFTKGAGTATTNDILLSPNFDVYVNCQPYDTISYIQESAGAKLNITPIET